jgi:hypothetical protein
MINPDELDFDSEDEVNDNIQHIRDIADRDDDIRAPDDGSASDDEEDSSRIRNTRLYAIDHSQVQYSDSLDQAASLVWTMNHHDRLQAAAKVMWGAINGLEKVQLKAEDYVRLAQKDVIGAQAEVL